MRKLLALVFCALFFAGAAAQENAPGGGLRISDTFTDIQDSDWLARLDNFAVALQEERDTKGVVVARFAPHRLPGWPLRRANWAVGYLTESRGIAPERLQVINGGPTDEPYYELIASPAGATYPLKPFDPALLMSGVKNPLLFDRFFLYDPSE